MEPTTLMGGVSVGGLLGLLWKSISDRMKRTEDAAVTKDVCEKNHELSDEKLNNLSEKLETYHQENKEQHETIRKEIGDLKDFILDVLRTKEEAA